LPGGKGAPPAIGAEDCWLLFLLFRFARTPPDVSSAFSSGIQPPSCMASHFLKFILLSYGMKTCVYLVNEHPFYMRELINSIKMLREYNSAIPVKLFLILDSANQTLMRKNMSSVNLTTDELRKAMDQFNIEVIEKEPFISPGDEGYFVINRTYLQELKEDHIFHIDADTFIFGDIEPLFEKYQDVDFAACESEWMKSTSTWTNEYTKGINPFNSGVMFWKNEHLVKWAKKLPSFLKELKNKEHPSSKWLYEVCDKANNREELSVSLYVAENNLSHKYISSKDCFTAINESSFQFLGKTLIFHPFTDQWLETYRRLTGKKPKQAKVKRSIIFKKSF
jgi:hypothetical protein